MTVDADITVEILRDIRDEMRGMRGELNGVNTRLDDLTNHTKVTNQRLEVIEDNTKVTNQRLEVIEHTLADFGQQHLMLTRYVGNVDRRQDEDIDDLRTRVTRLERRKKS
jgi:phage-related minor tail protein